ncbi:MAG: phosphatase PAP2 family protein [Phycisphaerales bacterium]|nr:phosphatase PAP2 family protein [Phycisphaerales bacterium]
MTEDTASGVRAEHTGGAVRGDGAREVRGGLIAGAREALTTPPMGFAGKSWFGWAVLTVVAIVLLLPHDAEIANRINSKAWRLPGDFRRELSALQQFGQGTSIALLALVVWIMDPARRVRLFDFALGMGVALLTALSAKMLIGRPRPKFDDPERFLGPFGVYPVMPKDGNGPPILAHAWDITKGISSDLWSMPSSHTASAAAFACFIAVMYPKLRWIALGLTCLVGYGRLLFDAHYPTDVLAGGMIGWVVARLFMGDAVNDGLGVKLARRLKLVGSAK